MFWNYQHVQQQQKTSTLTQILFIIHIHNSLHSHLNKRKWNLTCFVHLDHSHQSLVPFQRQIPVSNLLLSSIHVVTQRLKHVNLAVSTWATVILGRVSFEVGESIPEQGVDFVSAQAEGHEHPANFAAEIANRAIPRQVSHEVGNRVFFLHWPPIFHHDRPRFFDHVWFVDFELLRDLTQLIQEKWRKGKATDLKKNTAVSPQITIETFAKQVTIIVALKLTFPVNSSTMIRILKVLIQQAEAWIQKRAKDKHFLICNDSI